MLINLTCPAEVFQALLPTEEFPAANLSLYNLSDRVIVSVEVTLKLGEGSTGDGKGDKGKAGGRGAPFPIRRGGMMGARMMGGGTPAAAPSARWAAPSPTWSAWSRPSPSATR